MLNGSFDTIIAIIGIILFIGGFAWNFYDSYLRKDNEKNSFREE